MRSSIAPHVSISGGIAVLQPKDTTTAAHLVAITDKNLFRAELSGRNRMISSHTNPTPFHIAAEAR